ncbi:reverse transcriptase [Fusarium acutatum]|uniref:Reverse transcriptase n=1 Tax=Fusarium acutatum TaxID=78861 RepID=A0A8H4JD89_9HYPO|nr:reverse transcriptase [Fusarium acutatum]
MNDRDLQDYAVLAVAELYALNIEGSVVATPNSHRNWIKYIPTKRHDMQWPIRSMLWIRSDLEAEQVLILSADLTGAILRWPDREVLVVSVYMVGKDEEALRTAMRQLHATIGSFRNSMGKRTDVILAGDFNRHNQLWGGDDVTGRRQGEAGPIIDLMDEHGLLSLLPRGTKMWEGPGGESTIDLTLASAELADEMVHCGIYPTEHGSDHRAIQAEFDLAMPERTAEPRLLFKNALWNAIRERVKGKLSPLPRDGDVQTQTDRLIGVVLNAIHNLVLHLTKLHRTYTFWRNLARAQRQAGQRIDSLEDRAKEIGKEYHNAIKRQKKTHWDDFLADETNIWQAAKYLKPGHDANSNKVPLLKRTDGITTQDKVEQAEELLNVFFPPLPTDIEEEGPRPRRREVAMPNLTMEEVEEKVMEAKAWKAPGQDGLPAMVWKQLWPVVKERVLHLFRTSLDTGRLPSQWRTAKIIPLKKPNKGAYKIAKAWRPISLLSTLGKILETVVADRISHAAETYGLLPTNHFGTGLQSIAQSQSGQVAAETQGAWYTQGADQVDRCLLLIPHGYHHGEWLHISATGTATSWPPARVTTIADTVPVLQCRISAEQDRLERRLDCVCRRLLSLGHSRIPFTIKGDVIKPKRKAKILGVIMDAGLRFKKHIAEAATRGLTAAICLRRLRMLSPRTARQLFTATVAPAMDYASVVWSHARNERALSWFNRAQKIGARAITGAFRTVATAVMEAEANIQTVCERQAQAGMRMYINIKTVPKTHPLAALKVSASRRYMSPLKKLALAYEGSGTERMETIEAYAIPLWYNRVPLVCEADREAAKIAAKNVNDIVIATSASDREV